MTWSERLGRVGVWRLGALVAPEQTAVLDTDPDSARRTARAFLASYLRLDIYSTTMRRAGFGEADVAGGGSDALVALADELGLRD